VTNQIENIRAEIKSVIEKSILKAINEGVIPDMQMPEITIEIPREKENGDFSTNVAMQLTKIAKKPPRQSAEIIIQNIDLKDTYIEKVECAGPGFINFYLKLDWLFDTIRIIQKEKEDYGRINIGKNEKVMVEFVSANPTGPLHMGNARGGALGDCIASVLDAAGYDVTKEFYVNDAGNQIGKFGISLDARYIQLLQGEDAINFPEEGYHGEDIIEHMREYIEANGDKLLKLDPEARQAILVEYALKKNLTKIEKVLESYGVAYDIWFSEQSLYDSGEIQETLEFLQKSGYTVENEGAIWFKASEFGAEKDEVIVRNNGIPTYFLADIAYHRNKFLSRGFSRVINLLGADHHGHVARMKGAVSALGINQNKLDIVLFQLVRLYRNGEVAKMSKRTGKAISLTDLLDEVGVDAARFNFNMKTSGSHLDFDLDLAVKQSNENPVFYVQYAHARICSLLKLLEGEGISVSGIESVNLSLLQKKEEIELMKKLAEYPDEIRISALTLEPSRMTRFVMEVASLFHSFYNACRVKGEEAELVKARVILVDSTRIVIRNILHLLKITAPERM
jgi:arginyl-tRNA synthetase